MIAQTKYKDIDPALRSRAMSLAIAMQFMALEIMEFAEAGDPESRDAARFIALQMKAWASLASARVEEAEGFASSHAAA